MVHNGIEYGDMQLIAESYHLLREVVNLSNEEISEIFSEWNNGELDSYLIEITADLLTKKDPNTKKHMVDIILDKAKNKGTGKWMSQDALDLGEPLTLITESVFARYISTLKEERIEASKYLSGPDNYKYTDSKKKLVEKIREALYFSKIMSYAQGFSQMSAASKEYNWNLQYGEIAKIFRAGCIIRAQFLQKITDAYDTDPELDNLLLDEYFRNITKEYEQSVREVISIAIQAGIPVPTFSAAIAYYDSYRSSYLPANILQAQRDYFGAHTYERVDREGVFHFDWYGSIGEKRID
jgi:6-phosphogluconate dehydrogenase